MTVSMGKTTNTFTIGGDLTVNRLGYGAMHLTGYGMWGPPADPDNAIAVLRRAVELGVTFIDTADSYGPGFNEQIIKEALYPYQDDLVICTKGGMLRSGPLDWIHDDGRQPYIVACGRPEYLRQQVELSLRNLGKECIDLYQLHRIDPAVPLADQLGELVRLQQQGKIRHLGLSGQPEVSIEQITAARRFADIVAVENLYNIADRAGEQVLTHVRGEGMAFIPWFPLGHGGLLDPDGVLSRAAREYGYSASQVGLAWLLHHSPNTLLIPGTTSIDHLEQNMKATEVTLTDAEFADIADRCAALKPWRPSTQE
jgi:aryl-alcohol dehydrogenase-like predicted oxidoreductase